MQARSIVSIIEVRLTLTVIGTKRNCSALSAEHWDILPSILFLIMLTADKMRERISFQNDGEEESQVSLMPKLVLETPIIRKTRN
jgi:hypothetical protein